MVDSKLDMASSISFNWVCVDNIFVAKTQAKQSWLCARERRASAKVYSSCHSWFEQRYSHVAVVDAFDYIYPRQPCSSDLNNRSHLPPLKEFDTTLGWFYLNFFIVFFVDLHFLKHAKTSAWWHIVNLFQTNTREIRSLDKMHLFFFRWLSSNISDVFSCSWCPSLVTGNRARSMGSSRSFNKCLKSSRGLREWRWQIIKKSVKCLDYSSSKGFYLRQLDWLPNDASLMSTETSLAIVLRLNKGVRCFLLTSHLEIEDASLQRSRKVWPRKTAQSDRWQMFPDISLDLRHSVIPAKWLEACSSLICVTLIHIRSWISLTESSVCQTDGVARVLCSRSENSVACE